MAPSPSRDYYGIKIFGDQVGERFIKEIFLPVLVYAICTKCELDKFAGDTLYLENFSRASYSPGGPGNEISGF